MEAMELMEPTASNQLFNRLAEMEQRFERQAKEQQAKTNELEQQLAQHKAIIQDLEQRLALADKPLADKPLAQVAVADQAKLKRQTSKIKASYSNNSTASTGPTNLTKLGSSSSSTSTRRKLLKGLGLATVGLAATGAASLTPSQTKVAQAASGDYLLLGNSSIASNSTYLSQTGGTTSLDKGAVLVAEYNSSVSALPSQLTNLNVAVAGLSTDSNAGSSGIGGYFAGNRAPLYLQPMPAPGGTHTIGELYVDNSGDLYIYKSGGWSKVSGSVPAGNYAHLSPGTPDSGDISITGSVYPQSGLNINKTTGHLSIYYDDTPQAGVVWAVSGSTNKGLYVRGNPTYLDGGTVNIPNGLSLGAWVSKPTGSFVIPHPDPTKTATHDLRHCFVEAPTRGENIYRFSLSTSKNNEVITLNLPDYWPFLNENPQVWVAAKNHLGRAYGEVNAALTSLLVTCESAGEYNVLLIGTRKDEIAKAWWDESGVEKKIHQEWTTPDQRLTASKDPQDRLKEVVRAIKNKNLIATELAESQGL